MPPRFAYWTIILDGAPTFFRTKERERDPAAVQSAQSEECRRAAQVGFWRPCRTSPGQAKELRGMEKVRRFRDDRAQQMKAERESGEDPLAEFRRQRGRPADGNDDPSTRDAGDGSLRAS